MPSRPTSSRPVLLLGAGGHAKVLLGLLRAQGRAVAGVCAPELAAGTTWRGLPGLGDDERYLADRPGDEFELVIAVGQLVGGTVRERLYERYRARGFRFPSLIHPAAWVDTDVVLSDGVQVMAGAVIQADTTVGANTIVNTGARVDHDNTLGANVHIAPGAVLCGGVVVGDRAFVGCGATVLPGRRIGADAVVAAGATLVRDLPQQRTAWGPAAATTRPAGWTQGNRIE